MDREWSSQPLASDQTGWDWLSLHFNGGEKLMLFRLRQTDGHHFISGKWFSPDGNGRQIASSEITMTPTGFDRHCWTQHSDQLGHCDPCVGADDFVYAGEHKMLDGNALPLLGRPDPLFRKPQRGWLSGDDGLLKTAPEVEGRLAMFHLTALVTCLAILIYFLIIIQVGKARATYGIKAPAISGNPDFERIFRVQMNTLEWMPIFLPALWLFAIYISDAIAAALGVVWIVGRIVYHDRLHQGRRQTRTGLCDPGRRRGHSLAGRNWARSCGA